MFHNRKALIRNGGGFSRTPRLFFSLKISIFDRFGMIFVHIIVKEIIIIMKKFKSVQSLMTAAMLGKITQEEYEKQLDILSNNMTYC